MTTRPRCVACLLAFTRLATAALQATTFDHTLFEFSGEASAAGWRVNIYGRNAKEEKGTAQFEAVAGRNGKRALQLTTRNAGAHNLISPVIPDGPWRSRTYEALEVWYRGDGSKDKASIQVRVIGEDGVNYGYSTPLFLGSADWQRVVLRGFWKRRGHPPLDLSRIERLYIAGHGTHTIAVDSIRLLEGRRRIHLEPSSAPRLTIPVLPEAPTVDGAVKEDAWENAATVRDLKPATGEATFASDIRLGRVGSMLYIGARLRGEKPGTIPATWRDFDTTVWKDSCLELHLDPGDTNTTSYQFVVNSIGTRQDICTSVGWNGLWSAVATLDEADGWSVEIACDLSMFEGVPITGVPWGLNLKRHVVDAEGRFAEVSGWSQATPKPAKGFGTAFFAPLSDGSPVAISAELRELREGSYACRTSLSQKGGSPFKGTLEAVVFLPWASGTVKATAPFAVDDGCEAIVGLPLEWPLEHDGQHGLTLTARDDTGRVAGHVEYTFALSRKTKVDFADIVLWPPPRKLELAKDPWQLTPTVSISLTGANDTFPAEHLADMLTRRYGVQVKHSGIADARIAIQGNVQRCRPEGYTLSVTPEQIRIGARDPRGMYYAVRTLLDVIKQTTVGSAPAAAQCLKIEDWPETKIRVHYHRIDHNYRTPLGAQTYKDYIYNQLAGGRFNLLILNCRGGIQYDSHPELSKRSALSKDEMRDILAFARRHYIDVAPGGNTPGHASWIIGPRSELREDGDRNTLCMLHPDALPLVKDVYKELIELFLPTAYFHLGGDEIRWQTHALPEEKHCPRCKGETKRELLLNHWTELATFCREQGVRPILWEDMLSERWNGGGIYNTAAILPRLPKNIIMSSWTSNELSNAASVYRKLGFTPWRVTTSFGPSRTESFLEWHADYEALGVAQFTTSPWLTFVHFGTARHCNYATPAVHCCAACIWNPDSAARGWHRLVAEDGVHWAETMSVNEWGARQLNFSPILLDAACNASTTDTQPGDGKGWFDLGPEHDLSALPGPDLKVGGVPFKRPATDNDCVLARGEETSVGIPVGQALRGLVFLHTALAADDDIAKLNRRFFRQNTDPTGMPIATYTVLYADGSQANVAAQLGRNVHLWRCVPQARVMQGVSAFLPVLTKSQQATDRNAPDACVWTMDWKNPHPVKQIKQLTVTGTGTEAGLALLGLTAVR